MEEEDDDFYGGGVAAAHNGGSAVIKSEVEPKTERMDMSEEEGEAGDEDGEEEDDDDSDDDVQFTLEKPEGVKSEPSTDKVNTSQQRAVSSEAARSEKPTAPAARPEQQRSGSTAPPTAIKGTLTHNGKEGKDFPIVHTSQIDVDANPIWPPNGKPITEVDIDADLAEHSKPWRLPGTDQTDYFNYGFDEYSWTQYCVRQQTMANTISDQRQIDAQMKAFFGGGNNGPGGPGGPGAGGPPVMPGMPPGMGMPDQQQMMEMVNAGIIPPEFAQMMQMGGMPGMPGQGMGQNGGNFGPGQNSISPQPQSNQGFQPPQGPQQGIQGGFPPGGIEGYSPQQMAILQQDQQGQMGGAGRGRGRRGRGSFY